MSVESRLVQQYWVSDSHMALNHHLPAQYERLQRGKYCEELKRYWLSPDLTNVRGGRRFTDDWVNEICEEMKRPTFPRNYVICCGTNNIRDAGIMGLKKVKQQLLDWHRTLINTIEGTDRGTLLIVSPIPDNRCWTQWIGEELDDELRKMCHEASPKVRYVHFRSQKTTFSGPYYRWRRELFSDDVHLNEEGARQLAESIIQQQIHIPSAAYGFSSSGPSAARIAEAQRFRGEIDREWDLRVTFFLRSIRSSLPPS